MAMEDGAHHPRQHPGSIEEGARTWSCSQGDEWDHHLHPPSPERCHHPRAWWVFSSSMGSGGHGRRQRLLLMLSPPNEDDARPKPLVKEVGHHKGLGFGCHHPLSVGFGAGAGRKRGMRTTFIYPE